VVAPVLVAPVVGGFWSCQTPVVAPVVGRLGRFTDLGRVKPPVVAPVLGCHWRVHQFG